MTTATTAPTPYHSLRHPHEHPYPDVFKPSSPYPLFHLHPVFKEGLLKDKEGNIVKWEDLKGKSVALYFGDYACNKCKNFLPILLREYRTANESGDCQKIEIIYVPLDSTKQIYDDHRKTMPWLAIEYGDPIVEEFKQHFRVMLPPEIPKYGYGPRHNVPAMFVVDHEGRKLQDLGIQDEPLRGLRKWDFVSLRF